MPTVIDHLCEWDEPDQPEEQGHTLCGMYLPLPEGHRGYVAPKKGSWHPANHVQRVMQYPKDRPTLCEICSTIWLLTYEGPRQGA